MGRRVRARRRNEGSPGDGEAHCPRRLSTRRRPSPPSITLTLDKLAELSSEMSGVARQNHIDRIRRKDKGASKDEPRRQSAKEPGRPNAPLPHPPIGHQRASLSGISGGSHPERLPSDSRVDPLVVSDDLGALGIGLEHVQALKVERDARLEKTVADELRKRQRGNMSSDDRAKGEAI